VSKLEKDAPTETNKELKEVPRLPRAKFLSFRGADLFRIGLFATLLVALVALRKPCADGVARMVAAFDVPIEEKKAPEKTDVLRITGNESKEELRLKLEEYDNQLKEQRKQKKGKIIPLRGDESAEELERLGVSPAP